MKATYASIFGTACCLAMLVGCGSSSTALPPTPMPSLPQASATDVDPAQGEPQYWLDQPAAHAVTSNSFDLLWNAADEVSRDLLFKIDRRDQRIGLMTTQPLVSAQFFEPWRREVQTGGDLADASVATIRRTIYYAFTKQADGQFVVTPKVLVERQAIAERRVSGSLSRAYFRREAGTSGTQETDAGEILPDSYWYPIGRDEALEAKIAEKLRAAL